MSVLDTTVEKHWRDLTKPDGSPKEEKNPNQNPNMFT